MLNKLFARGGRGPRRIVLQPLGESLRSEGDETVLEAALRHGVAFPNKCRAGACGSCKCRLVEGKVKELTDSSYTLSAEELQAGYILACQSRPRSDLTLEVPGLAAGVSLPEPRTLNGRIARLERVTDDILELEVELEEKLPYVAGQYAEISLPGMIDEPRSFSFANAPGTDGQRRLHFHVRRVPDGELTGYLFEHARPGEPLKVAGPFGDFRLRSGKRPILCVAGGTGLAPIKAMLDQALAGRLERDVLLFYGTRRQLDLYCVEHLRNLAGFWQARFEFVPVLSEEPHDSDWTGERGLVTEALERRGEELTEHEAYLCGPPGMIDRAIEVLRARGVPEERIHFDKFLDRSHTATMRRASV